MFKKIAIVIGMAALVWVFSLGWQIGAAELANVELQGDLKDVASQLGAWIGFSAPMSDEGFRDTVVRKAQKDGIELSPDQVTVVRTTSGDKVSIYLAVDYRVPIHVPGFFHTLHFHDQGGRKP